MDVAYIMSAEERRAFDSRPTDQERELFAAQFWQRRDPTPNTLANEFRDEHYARMTYANEHFASRSAAGWQTDRGRIYIMYGKPDETEIHSQPAVEFWLYHLIEGIGANLLFSSWTRTELEISVKSTSRACRKPAPLQAGAGPLPLPARRLRNRIFRQPHITSLHVVPEIRYRLPGD
jgi:GWxTD domain-containing protein